MRYLFVLLLTGCATTDMVKVAEPQIVSVQWVREAPTFCGAHKVSRGCTWRTNDFKTCKIWATEDVSDEVLGHELRHCFGYDHAADVQTRAEDLRRATRNSVQWDF